MKKNLKKVLAMLLALTMVVGLTACGGKDNNGDGGSKKDTPLVVGYSAFSQKFSPFTADTQYDQDAVGMTQVGLMTTDRVGGIIKNGIEGEVVEYNGTEYTYYGIADLDWSYDKTTDVTTYTAKLREDLKFSDGKPLTADDVIFTYYVLLDNSYVGSTTLNSYSIQGLKNYQNNSTAAEGVEVPDADVAALVANPDETLAASISAYIADVLTSEMAWCGDVYADYEFPDKVSFFVASYGPEGYDATGKDEATVLSEVIAAYGTDYKTLAMGYAGDETYFDGDITSMAYTQLFDAAVAAAQGDPVDYITGISKTGDYSIEVKVNGFDAAAVYSVLGITVVPMHYYGDESLYDYDAHKFGFTRGDLTAVNAKEKEPMGAGPYIFKEYTNKTVYFEANPYYYLGEPKIKNVQFKEVITEEMASNVESGTVDCGEMTGSVTRFNEVKSYNSNGEISGDVITTSKVDNLGYGYIGCNSDTVLVGSDKNSEESKALRKAFMTVMAVYRDTVIDTYYGEAASVINYPISNTSWAAPQATDDDYQVAYSKDVDGNDIYTSDMSAEERYEAAIKAAVGFLKKAGYTYDEATGKFTAAPSGAKMSYSAIIPAEGKGDHPAFGVLTDAKAALETIGIEFIIDDPADTNKLWDSLDAGTQEFWCAAWGSTIDPDMYQVYHSSNVVGLGGSDSNHYHIQVKELDELIMAGRTSDDQSYRKAVYKQCLDIIMDTAVELPTYQRQNCVIFSSKRINLDTITPDITTYWGWKAEIEKLEMN